MYPESLYPGEIVTEISNTQANTEIKEHFWSYSIILTSRNCIRILRRSTFPPKANPTSFLFTNFHVLSRKSNAQLWHTSNSVRRVSAKDDTVVRLFVIKKPLGKKRPSRHAARPKGHAGMFFWFMHRNIKNSLAVRNWESFEKKSPAIFPYASRIKFDRRHIANEIQIEWIRQSPGDWG